MPTNTAVNRSVNIYIESGEAEKAQQRLQKKWDDVSASLKKATDPTQVAKLNAELKKIEEPLDRANKKLTGQLKPSFTELTKTVNALGQRLKQMSTNDADFSKTLVQYNQAKVSLDEMKVKMDKVSDAHKSFFSQFSAGFKDFLGAAGLIGGVTAAFGFLKGSIDEAMQAEENAARLKNTLDNLGRSDAFDRLSRKAVELAQQFKYLDNDDVVAVFEKLITYGKLTEKQMTDLTPVIINFAAKQRISLEESTSVITKALEGNGKALKEYGINIKDAKTETERLNIVMTTLKEKVDGAADAFGETTAGKAAIAKQAFKDLEEEVGTGLLPMLNKLLQAINFVVIGLTDVYKRVKDVVSLSLTQNIAGKLADKATEFIEQKKQEAEQYMSGLDATFDKMDKKQLDRELKSREQSLKNSQTLVAAAKRDNDQAQLEYERDRVYQEQAAIENLKKRISVLGTGDTTKEKDKPAKQIENLFKEFHDKITQGNKDLDALNLGQFAKELQQNEDKYNALNDQLDKALKKQQLTRDQYNKLILESDDLRAREQDLIVQRELERIADNDTKLKQKLRANQAEYDKQREAENQRMYNKALDEQKNLVDQLTKLAGSQIGDKKAALELQALKNHGAAQLKAQKDLLDLEEQQALAKTDLTENQIALIQEQYRQKRLDADLAYINKILGFFSQALQAFQSFAQAQTDRENADLARNDKLTDRKRRNYEGLYAKGLITRDEFDRKNSELDKQNDDKHKKIELEQFERNKKLSIAQAIINGLQGVTKTIADFGPPIPPNFIGIAAMALTLLTTGLQVGAIAKQKPPEFAKGGTFLSGPSHREGGMPIINPRTGRKVAEIEGGEVILSKRTVSNNPALVSSLLHNSMHRNGAALDPFWKNQPATYLNYSRLNKTLGRMRYFADGGVMPGSGGSSQESEQNAAVQMEILGVLADLRDQLRAGIKAPINLSELEIQQQRIARIRADATAS